MPLLELTNLTKDFPGVRALDGVSLSLEAGEVSALCGENGAGKSTLLKILAGCHPAGSYGGEIFIDGSRRGFDSPRAAEEAGVALVAQELALVPELSIAENICLGDEPRRGLLLDWKAVRQRASEALERVGLKEDPSTPVGRLSVARQQLVEIAKALSKKARLLILDEPSAALSEADVERLLELVKELAASGVGVLYVSHRLEEVFKVARTITVLRDGRTVRSAPVSECTRESVVRDMVGRELAEADSEAIPEALPGEPALEIEDWSLAHPLVQGRFALEGASLALRRGEILGLGGLMGAGRTALLSSLFGAARSRCQGRLRLAGGTWRGPFARPDEAVARGLGLVSDDRKNTGLVLCASVKENLALASLRRLAKKRGFLDWEALDRESAAQRDALRVKAPSLEAEVSGLSGGNQQKVVLGRWLMAGSKVLLLDEPTRGVDVGAKAEIHRLIRALAAQGLAVLMASSDLPELLSLSHRVLVLAQGRVKAELKRAEFSQENVMREAI